MKKAIRILFLAMVSALAFAGCSDKDDNGQSAEQEVQISSLKADLGKLRKAYEELENVRKGLEDEKERLESEKAELEKRLAEAGDLKVQLAGLDERLETCETNIRALDGYKDKLEKVLGDASEVDYTGLVGKVLEGLETLGNMEVLCEGFESGTKIKEYIDQAVKDLTSSPGNYLLQTTFNEFKEEYTEFKTTLESAGYVTSEEVEVMFAGANGKFKEGVLEVLTEALEQGELTDELQKALKELGDSYASDIEALRDRVAELENKVDGLLNRIQSLVYVPKTSDGKIHIGTSYIRAVDEGGAETGEKIEVATTKKLEYRVSPASLRDNLLLYEAEVTFSFYQAHVSREGIQSVSHPEGYGVYQTAKKTTRADAREGHDGLNEFNFVKVEAGNDPGTILITVDNEHDFTHENLAVALCIRHENKETGVLTEYASAYTTVIGEGANLIGRFYLAKKEKDGSYSKISRTDRIDYTLIYNDETQITLMEDYEMVYDNGETVMSLEEAKEKYEWDADLDYKIERTGKTGGSLATNSSVYTADTSSGNKAQPVTFRLNPNAISSGNVGKDWLCEYDASITSGMKSVDILSDFRAYVTVMPTEYTVDARVTWNSSNWYTGKYRGWHSDNAAYTSGKAELKYKKDNQEVTASNLPGRIRREIFADEHLWTVSGVIPEGLNIDNSLEVSTATTLQDLAFTVKGYKYSKDTKTVKMSRQGDDGIATSGTQKITVTGQLTFVGPSDNDLQFAIGSKNPVEMSTDPDDYKGKGNGSPYALMYMLLEKQFAPDGKILPLDRTFFPASTIFNLCDIDMEGVTCTRQTGGDENHAPENLSLEYYTQTGGRPYPTLRSVNVKQDEKIKTIASETTYKLDKGFDIVVPDGPTIKVTGGTFKFVPKN